MVATLLDSHALVWLLDGKRAAGKKTRTLIQQLAQADSLHVSAITPWEIAMLVSKGRLTLVQEVGEWLRTAISLPGVRLARAFDPATASQVKSSQVKSSQIKSNHCYDTHSKLSIYHVGKRHILSPERC